MATPLAGIFIFCYRFAAIANGRPTVLAIAVLIESSPVATSVAWISLVFLTIHKQTGATSQSDLYRWCQLPFLFKMCSVPVPGAFNKTHGLITEKSGPSQLLQFMRIGLLSLTVWRCGFEWIPCHWAQMNWWTPHASCSSIHLLQKVSSQQPNCTSTFHKRTKTLCAVFPQHSVTQNLSHKPKYIWANRGWHNSHSRQPGYVHGR